LWSAIARFADLLDEGQGAPVRPVRGSRVLIAATILGSALPLSGVPRFILGVSLNTSLLITIMTAAAFVLTFWPTLGLKWRQREGAATFLLVSICYSAVALMLLAATPYNGFPASSGGDAGNHLYYKNAFALDEPKTYEGMVSLYALVHWLIVLGYDDLSAFRFAWRLIVIACVMLACAVAGAGATAAHTRSARWALHGAIAGAIAVVGFWVALPLLRYYQCDGFLSQIFALIPLTFVAGTYAFVDRRVVRALVLLAGLGFYRFCYLLNAGDLALACAVAFFFEWREAPRPRRTRWALLVMAVVCVFGGGAAYLGLNKAIRTPGGFFAAPMLPQLVGLGLVSVAFGALGPVCDRFDVPVSAAHRRLARFLFVFTLAPTIGVSAWLALGGPVIYYIQKYSFCATVLGALCVVPVVSTAVFALIVQTRSAPALRAGLGLMVVVVVGLWELASSANGYMPLLREGFATSSHSYLQPVGDRSVWRIIAKTLRNEHAEFGGFLTPRWPEAQFSNAHFALTSAGPSGDPGKPAERHVWPFAKYADAVEGRPIESAGHCVFWYEDDRLPLVLRQRWSRTSRAAVDRLEAAPLRSCETFAPRDAPDTQLAVCKRCFGAHEADAAQTRVSSVGPEELGLNFGTEEGDHALRGTWTRSVEPPHAFVQTAETLAVETLLTKPAAGAYGLALVAKAVGLVAGETLEVGVSINGRQLRGWHLGTSWDMHALILPPDTLQRGRNLLEFVLQPGARNSAWLVVDSLHLGPLLSRAEVEVAPVSARGSLIDGYYADEIAGRDLTTWSAGLRTRVSMLLSPQDTAYDLELDGDALTSLQPLDIEARINAKTTVKAVIGKEARTIFRVPRGALTYGLNDIEFVYSKTAKPSETFEGSQDTRDLAVRINRISAVPTAPP